MKENGKMIKYKDKEFLQRQMVIYMMVNGLMIKCKDMENSCLK